ncbi:sensor histidine kinase [Tritonibacter sp. SIMBA_163]|uniref:sensor histidine kinase n=1 Tax=Tritonibacter sp. SIMBA_163 TaxID=3080868 RepID=UPI0039809C39
MQSYLRLALYGVVASALALLWLIGHDWYRQLNQIDDQQDQIAELGRSYGEVMWRVTSARRWWLEYNHQVHISYLTDTDASEVDFSLQYQFFKQNLNDALALEGDVIEIAQVALDQLGAVLERTEALHNKINEVGSITAEIRDEADSIKKEVIALTASLGTFQYVYFGPSSLQAPIKRDLMVRSLFFLSFLFILAISAIAIYRHGIIQEERAKQTKLEALGALAAGYSHAISSIIGGLQIILDSLRVSQRNPRDLAAFDQFEIGIERMRSLNINLSLIARGHPINDSLAPLGETINASVDHPSDPDHPVTYHLGVSHDVSGILVPQLAVSTIISELLSNSKHHASRHVPPNVWIDAEVTGKADLRITIADNGIGIPSQNIPMVLDPFFSTSGEGHAGLGLTSIKSMVEAMRGTIRISARVGGQGTCVEIVLPLENETVSPPLMGQKSTVSPR